MIHNAYELLGIGPAATRQELEAAYAHKLSAYAPERHAQLAPEFQAQAATRRAEIRAAYLELRPALSMPVALAPAAERRRERQTIAALLLLAAIAALIPLLGGIAVPERSVVPDSTDGAAIVSDVAPDVTLQALDGSAVTLSDYRGKVVLLNFWATWCPPCVREIPRLVRVAEDYKDRDLVVLGINTTFQDDPAKVRQFVVDQAISYPILLDTEGAASKVYPARLMPSTYLIGRDGRIAHTKVGEVDEATLRGQVERLLAPAGAAKSQIRPATGDTP